MLRQQRVFVVDDEPSVRRAVQQSLEALDVDVVCFPGAELCLDALKEERCDLVITDITMPEMDGLTLLERAREVAPLTKVLMVTGYGSVPLAVKSMRLGASDFMEKPLDESVLLPKVEALLGNCDTPDGDNITPAEEQVLELVAEGKANKEIAYLIGRSKRTVENHRHRLMKKLGVGSTAELIKVALVRTKRRN